MPKHSVFISYAITNKKEADIVTASLETSGIDCWIAPRDISPGADWGFAISDAIKSSKAFVLIFSSNANSSAGVSREIQIAVSQGIPVILIRIENITPSNEMEYFLSSAKWFDAFGSNLEMQVGDLADRLRGLLPGTFPAPKETPEKLVKREDKSKGYVFISYVHSDDDFVLKLRKVLEAKKYGYWDYAVGVRDYHGTLYRELEERIDNSVAFMTIVSDDWRKSEWVASEFIYAREARIPIFVIQAKKLSRPLPILLNLQTRIDMSGDFERGAKILIEELSKQGL